MSKKDPIDQIDDFEIEAGSGAPLPAWIQRCTAGLYVVAFLFAAYTLYTKTLK